MDISPVIEAKYEENRLRMAKVNKDLRTYMWLGIILGAIIFSTAFFVAASSTKNANQEGPWIFYYAMSTGAFQILLGIGTIALSWLTAMKYRSTSLILLCINFLGLVMIFMNKNGSFSSANFIFLLLGLALNFWIQHAFNEHDELKTQIGYPLFSTQADYRAHYEVPKDVLARRAQASTHMAEISRTNAQPEAEAIPQPSSAFDSDLLSDPKPVRLPPEVKLSAVSEDLLGISEMTGSTEHKQYAPRPDTLSAPTDISLDALVTHTPQSHEAALPQVNSEDVLADMTALPSHATTKGNPDMLPTPEDVRARMEAMKRARKEHHPEE